MKQFFTAIGVLAAALALSLSTASSAAAAPTAPVYMPTPMKSRIENVPVTAVEQRTCRARFSERVNHRRLADTGAAILEVIPANTWVQVSCERGAGGEYSACGLTSDYWMEVLWNGAWGYSAWACVKDWEYTS